LRRITLEIPLEALASHAEGSGVLGNVLLRSGSVRFVWVDLERYLLVCRVRPMDAVLIRHKAKEEAKTKVEVIGRGSSRTVILRVAGDWVKDQDSPARRFLLSFGDVSAFPMAPPEVRGGKFTIVVAAENRGIKSMLKKLDQFGVQYRVASIDELGAGEGDTASLTLQQQRILRLAYATGYYDIPRRVGTAKLAEQLGMHKATVGDHLRRAEKHIMDDYFSSNRLSLSGNLVGNR